MLAHAFGLAPSQRAQLLRASRINSSDHVSKARHAGAAAVPGLLAGGLLLATHLRAKAPAPAGLSVALVALPYAFLGLGGLWMVLGLRSVLASDLEILTCSRWGMWPCTSPG